MCLLIIKQITSLLPKYALKKNERIINIKEKKSTALFPYKR